MKTNHLNNEFIAETKSFNFEKEIKFILKYKKELVTVAALMYLMNPIFFESSIENSIGLSNGITLGSVSLMTYILE